MSELEPGAAHAVLAERARALARPLERPPEGEELGVVAFSVRQETFCIEASYVREVVRLRHLAAVPGAPPAVRGVTTYRGEILATLDIGMVLGRRSGGLADMLWLIVLGNDTPEFGLIADEVGDIARVRLDDLRPPSEDASPATRRLVRGIAADALIVLDGAALLADLELFMPRKAPPAEDAGATGRDRSNYR